MQAAMNTAMTAEAMGGLKSRPPSCTGLSRKSPTVAPSGASTFNVLTASIKIEPRDNTDKVSVRSVAKENGPK